MLVCAEAGAMTTSMGYGIEPRYGLRSVSRADTIIVPAWRDVRETPPELLLRALRSAHRRGARIASLCTGAFVLGHAGLLDGRRAFARHFRAETGTTPLQWLLAQRIVEAQRMLESTDEPVVEVAIGCGFGSSAALRMHFRRTVGTSPASYRRTFRARAAPV